MHSRSQAIWDTVSLEIIVPELVHKLAYSRQDRANGNFTDSLPCSGLGTSGKMIGHLTFGDERLDFIDRLLGIGEETPWKI